MTLPIAFSLAAAQRAFEPIRRHVRRQGALLPLVAGLLLTLHLQSSDASAAKRVLVEPGDTDTAELHDKLPIGRTYSNAPRKVLMRIPHADLPPLASGDTLRVGSEIEFTTRCDVGQSGNGCGYGTTIHARAILTNQATDTDVDDAHSAAITPIKDQVCNAQRHHCHIEVSFGPEALTGAKDLPCIANNACLINFVAWANAPESNNASYDHILVGQNEGNYLQNGIIDQDFARLMVVREREITGSDLTVRDTTQTRTGDPIQLNMNPENPQLLYSHPLRLDDRALEPGQQFRVAAKITTAATGRIRFSTEMFLAENPGAVQPPGGGVPGISPNQLTEHNGINCLGDISPCVTRKVGVFSVGPDIEQVGNHTVYVNIYSKSEERTSGSGTVKNGNGDGFIESTLYDASLKG